MCMKKILLLLLTFGVMTSGMVFAQDKYSQEYLKNHKHFAIMNPIAESMAERVIKKSLKKDTGADFDVKFTGYTLSSMKKGIFKYLEIVGSDVVIEDIPLDYIELRTLSDYNYIDYTQDPPAFKSDMKFAYELKFSEEAMNVALKHSDYQKVLNKVNDIAYPLFQIKGVSTKIRNNRIYILTEYNFPIAPSSKNRVFVSSSDFKVQEGQIKAANVKVDNVYGNLSTNKVANLINLLNPLDFTLKLLDTKKCNAKLENVNIVDNKVQINGKIFVEGD